jgi:predicted nucleotidyltransferase component of viral defense system
VSKGETNNLATSVQQRLVNLSREQNEDPNHILTRYAIERFLYRLSRSGLANHFVLKGAMLFSMWTGRKYRPTKDVDFSGFGEDLEQRLESFIQQICRTQVEPDGLEFDADSIQVQEIREDQEYQGQRVNLTVFLGNARIGLQIDVGFGDAITPRIEEIRYPTILDFPAALIRACPRETVVAEKLQAMVSLGMVNSRMKDFYDLLIMAKEFSFDGSTLVQAIEATFDRRRTSIPLEVPTALSDEFMMDRDKGTQWQAFLKRNNLEEHCLVDFTQVIKELKKFLVLPLKAAASDKEFYLLWPASGPWMENK